MLEQSPNGPNSQSLQDVITATEMLDAQALLTARINDTAHPDVRIDPNALYCSKTGQPIGQRDANSIFASIKIHGKNDFLEFAYFAHGLHVHPAWVRCDGKTLDKLMEQDPLGYACYAFGLITSKFTNKPLRSTQTDIAQHHYAMARAYAVMAANSGSLQAFDWVTKSNALVELNFSLCEFLTFAPESTHYMVRQLKEFAHHPDTLARLSVEGKLKPILDNIINKSVAAFGNFNSILVREKAHDLPASADEGANGPSQIRHQKRSKSRAKTLRLDKQFGEFGFGRIVSQEERERMNEYENTRKPKWTAFVVRPEMVDKPLPANLQALANLDFDDWVMPNEEEDDGKVEVRKMSADEIAAHNLDKFGPQHPEIIKEPAPVVTGSNAGIFGMIASSAHSTTENAQPAMQPTVAKPLGILAMLAKGAKK